LVVFLSCRESRIPEGLAVAGQDWFVRQANDQKASVDMVATKTPALKQEKQFAWGTPFR
jgi:hypothetical protein